MTSLRLVIVVLTDQLFNIEVFDLYVDTNDFIEEYGEELHVFGHTCQGTYRFMEHSRDQHHQYHLLRA